MEESRSETHVALLRGINVGGKNKISMRDLTGLFAEAGAADVRTYIQSGNVVFRGSSSVAKSLPEVVTDRLLERFGVRSPIVLRTAREMDKVVRGQPFAGEDEKSLHVVFLQAAPSKAAGGALSADRSPGDALQLAGREVYLHLPRGVSATKFTNAWFDRTLETVSTMRNWKTVCTLAEMAAC